MRVLSTKFARGLLVPLLLLQFTRPPAVAAELDCHEPNDTLSDACAIGLGTPVSGAFDADNDIDLFVFNVPDGGATARATITCLQVDCDLRLGTVSGENGAPVVLERGVQIGIVPETVQLPLDPGAYFLQVDAPNGPWGPDATYVLRLEMEGPGICPPGAQRAEIGIWKSGGERPPMPPPAGHCEWIVAHGAIKGTATCHLTVFSEGQPVEGLGSREFKLVRVWNGTPEDRETLIEEIRRGAAEHSSTKQCPRI